MGSLDPPPVLPTRFFWFLYVQCRVIFYFIADFTKCFWRFSVDNFTHHSLLFIGLNLTFHMLPRHEDCEASHVFSHIILQSTHLPALTFMIVQDHSFANHLHMYLLALMKKWEGGSCGAHAHMATGGVFSFQIFSPPLWIFPTINFFFVASQAPCAQLLGVHSLLNYYFG